MKLIFIFNKEFEFIHEYLMLALIGIFTFIIILLRKIILFSIKADFKLEYFSVNLYTYSVCKSYAEMFFRFEIQSWTRVIISHIKWASNLIIFNTNEHLNRILIICC